MPPPHFSTTTQSGTANGSSAAGHVTGAPSLNDLPKVQRHLVRDALQYIRASLTGDDAGAPSPNNRAIAAAYEAIRKLRSDPVLQSNEEVGAAHTSSSGRGKAVYSQGTGGGGAGSGGTGGASTDGNGDASSSSEARLIRKQVSLVLASALSRIFSDEMDQDSRPLTQLLISYLHALHAIMDPLCVVWEWWDVLLRPALKNAHCNPSIARKAHALVIWAMRSTPSSAYVDEAAPSPVWPAPAQSPVAADSVRMARRPGDAPYPVSSTRTASQSRSSESDAARLTSLYSTRIGTHASGNAASGGNNAIESLRRFTQRVFDLYTSEALSAGTRDIEDDDIKEVAIDEPSPDESETDPLDQQLARTGSVGKEEQRHGRADQTEVGPTWKGNLEAIILTFGEERPKAFFHHLSESFLDPSARIPILLLVTIFFRISSLHAYHIVSTPFVRLLVLSLQLDTSSTSAALGTFALATLIPHIPNWIANGGAGGLPALLSIMARIMDWRKLAPQWERRSAALDGEDEEEWAQVARISRRLQVRQGIEWKRLDTTFDTVAPPPPDAEKLFTFLYGVFPCNVIRFLRAPVDYLRKAEYESPFQVDWDDIIDEVIVQNRAAPILRRHILHPSLVDMDAESEITDKQRWRDHDAADITAECICLHIEGQADASSGLWLESGRGSLVDHLPSLLSFRRMSGSTTSAHQDGRAFSALADSIANHLHGERSGGMDGGNQTPVRYYRKRSESDGPGRRYSIGSLSALDQGSTSRRRDLSAQPGQHAGTALLASPRTLPFPTHSSMVTNESDVFLQNHVRLRYGLPPVTTGPGFRAAPIGGAGSQQGSLSRSSSIRSQLRTFSAARTNLTASVMSPNASQVLSGSYDGLAKEVGLPTSPVESHDEREALSTEPDSAKSARQRSFGETLDAVSPKSTRVGDANEQLIGSPALSMPDGKQTRSRLKEEVKQTIAYLKQENLQLRNELNYEMGQKDQILRHVGRIHRDRMKDTVLEDERQNLYQTVRTLRAQIKAIRTTQERSKAETITSKNRHASWENELNAKLKAFREEKKIWVNEVRQLQIVKEDHEALIAKLEGQLHENANEVFELREQCKRDARKVEAIRAYEDKTRRLEECLRMWDEDMRKFDAQRREMDVMSNRYAELAMLLEANESDRRRADRRAAAAERQTELLDRQLRATQDAIDRQERAERAGQLLNAVSATATTTSSASPALGSPLPSALMSRRGSHTAAGRGREEEEKARLRVRLEKVEAELLDVKAQHEKGQLDQLVRRLQDERKAIPSVREDVTAAPHVDQDVAPLDLNEGDDDDKANESQT